MLLNLLSVLFVLLVVLFIFVMVGRKNTKTIYYYYINNIDVTEEKFNSYIAVSNKNIEIKTRKNGNIKIVEYYVTVDHYLYQLKHSHNMSIEQMTTILKAIKKEGKVHVGLVNESGKVLVVDNKPVERFCLTEDLYWTLVAENEIVKLNKYWNAHYTTASELFDFSIAMQKRQNVGSSFVVRWVGAYNTYSTKETFDFTASFEWETSAKEREVAAQIFSTMQELIDKTNSPINKLDFVEVGIMYKSKDVTEAYSDDVCSFNLGPILMPQENKTVKFNQFDKIDKTLHSEAFVAINALPTAIVIRKHITDDKLAIVEKIATEKGLEIIRL